MACDYEIFVKKTEDDNWTLHTTMHTFQGAIEYANKAGFTLIYVKDGEWYYNRRVSIDIIVEMFTDVFKNDLLKIKEVVY